MKITNDFETKSKKDLQACGAWAYAEHESTDVFCWSFKIGNEPTQIWIKPYYLEIIQPWIDFQWLEHGIKIKMPLCADPKALIARKVKEGYLFEAHNAEFEQAIFKHVMVERYDWPEIPLKQWRCSAAKAAVHQLPRSLDGVAEALGLENRIDKEGHRIMLRLSKPKKPSKKSPGIWDEDPEKLVKLFRYCIQDTNTEHELSDTLRDLSKQEQEMWFIDQTINRRGVHIDTDSVHHIIRMFESREAELFEECLDLTGLKPTQNAKLLDWINAQGVKTENLQADTVTRLLNLEHIDDKIRRVLQIRQQAGKTSVKKYYAMLNSISKDRRARGCFMFNGAGTGRWSGQRVQFQNIIRAHYNDFDECLKLVRAGEYKMVEMLYDDLITTASKMIRSMIMASAGKKLMAADYKSIEGRVLAWLADEDFILDAYYEGKDLYKVAASGVFGVPYDQVNKDQRQIGKVIELACGYQGHWKAFMEMSKIYDVEPPEDIIFDKKDMRDFNGRRLKVREAKFKKWTTPFITAWRANRPKTKEFWYELQNAAFECIRKPGKTVTVGYLRFATIEHKGHRFMHIRLPSGRVLNYFDPRIANVLEKKIEVIEIDGKEIEQVKKEPKKQLTYMGVDSTTKQFKRIYTYGGKLSENVTQAVANDFLRFALLNFEKAGFPTIFHVHDEGVTEVDENFGNVNEYLNIMRQVPNWGKGCPIEVEGFEAKRYKKG